MQPTLTISRQQLAALARPPQQKHRAQVVQAMGQQELHHATAWWPAGVPAQPEAQVAFYGTIYDWAVASSLADWEGLPLAGALLWRARRSSWPPEDVEHVLCYLEADTDPDAVLAWLACCFDQ